MKRFTYGLAALALCAPLLANAAEGFVVADISLQAGPDTDYPSITELAAGTPVTIAGCIQGWTWCDVIVSGDRGWVPGTFLEEVYGGQRVIVMDYGPRIGIPVVSFSIGAYWDHYYHNRPFYAQRHEFETRAIHPHAPPRPSGVAATHGGTQRSGTATVAAPAQSASERNAQTTQQRTTTQQAQQHERATTQQQRETQERTAAQQRSTTNERVPQTAQRTDETRPQKQSAQTERRVAQKPQHEETPPAAKPTETPPPGTPHERAQNPRGTVTAKAQQQKKAEPKTKDELSKPKKDEKDNGGGKEL